MASTSLLALIDDVATVLDDVSMMTKVAGKKTAGLIGDDLAVNAEQVTGVSPKRELAVIWAVARGGLINKAILVPAALLISAFLPWALTPLLMFGGAFLAYEGAHKVFHKLFHHGEEEEGKERLRRAFRDGDVDMVEFEKKKIRGAIRTDFILSAEIIVIALNAVTDATLTVQLGVLIAISLLVTVGVYGLVAGIVRLDDTGMYLARRPGDAFWDRFRRDLGEWILRAAPWLMKTIGIVGTGAMFLVGGGILSHGIHAIEEFIHHLAHYAGPAEAVATMALQGVFGVIAGAVLVPIVGGVKKLWPGEDDDDGH